MKEANAILTKESAPSETGHRILIVDDNPAIHADFQKILVPWRNQTRSTRELEDLLFGESTETQPDVTFSLDSAYQGQEALEMLRRSLEEQRPYALAFVDVRMPPGWDGFETLGHLWSLYPKLQVVICTAYSDYSWDEMRARFGQPDSLVVLKKPFDNVEVQQLAHALTRKWELNLSAELRLEELESAVQQRTLALTKANQELARSEERFAQAFNLSPLAMAICTVRERRCVVANRQMLELAGRKRDEVIGQPCEKFVALSAPKELHRWFAEVDLNGSVVEEPAIVTNNSGQAREVLVSLASVMLSGEAHALVLIQDVTERHLLERKFQQAQKMEVVGQLAAGVAHDFNNLLTIIQGHASMIQLQLGAARSPAESAEIIVNAAKRAAGLTRQLLAFSRKQVMQLRPIELNHALEQSLGMIGRLVGEHIRIVFKPEENLPLVEADPTMLEQVVMNLSVNARDAMASGGTITITTSSQILQREATSLDPEARSGRFVQLEFRDTGGGMDEAVLAKVFEPFFTTKPVGRGTGLGLSTVFGIVRQHRGWIEVESKPDRGATFRILLPVCESDLRTMLGSESAMPAARNHETVLVAEDEKVLRDLICHGLEAHGYEVLAAATGAEALRLYEQSRKPVDLVLTDILLPGGVMGWDLAQRVRELAPQQKVVFTSGFRPEIGVKQGEFLPKPFSIPELLQFVRAAIDQVGSNR